MGGLEPPTHLFRRPLFLLSYTVLIYLPIVSRKNHSCLLQPGIIVNNRSICHGRTRLNPPSVIVRHKLGWFFLTVAPTRLKVSFTSRHTRLLLYRLLLIADVPAVSRPAISAEFQTCQGTLLWLWEQGDSNPPTLPFRGRLYLLAILPIETPFGVGALLPLGYMLTPEQPYRWFDFGGVTQLSR